MSSSQARWTRLIRFLSPAGHAVYGDVASLPASPSSPLTARIIQGHPLERYTITNETVEVEEKDLLAPLQKEAIPLIRLIGLNYKEHARESNLPEPPSPPLFVKPRTAAAGPRSTIVVPRIASSYIDKPSGRKSATPQIDYEGELVVVIGKECKDVSRESAMDHVAGFAVGQDVSAREWQMNNGSQWSFSKGFDGWAPFGPYITSPSALPSSSSSPSLNLRTKVNSTLRQSSSTSDMIYDVPTIISFLSSGTTLEPGTLIFTGTPKGVAMGVKDTSEKEKSWLRDGDVVEVEIEGLGRLRNEVRFEGGEADQRGWRESKL